MSGTPPPEAFVPEFHRVGDGRMSAHGTAVALDGRGLLILGPSGAGKSGLAAQFMVQGARLVSDDLTLIDRGDTRPVLRRPDGGPELIELRGLGLVPVPVAPEAPLAALLCLTASPERLPDNTVVDVHGHLIPIRYHPYRFDLPAKVMLWLAALND